MFNKKILIVDDERDIVDLIELILKKEGFKRIYKAYSGEEGIRVFEEIGPDLVVLDIMLGDMEGFEVCKVMRQTSICSILFLSAKAEELDKILGFTLGGDDYITKPFSPKELAFRIKAHLRRNQFFNTKADETRIRKGDLELFIDKGYLLKNGDKIYLKPKELKLMRYFMENEKLIKTKEQIYENIWDDYYMGDIDSINNSIMVQIRNLRKEVEDDPSNPKYIITVKGLGYKFVSGDSDGE